MDRDLASDANPARFAANGTAGLLAAPHVPRAVVARLRASLLDAGIAILPGAVLTIALFAELDEALRQALDGLRDRPGQRVLGVALTGGTTTAAPEALWCLLGYSLHDLVLWDGTAGPGHLIAARLAEDGPALSPWAVVYSPHDPRAQGNGRLPVIEVVLRNGRVMRVPATVAATELRHLVEALDG